MPISRNGLVKMINTYIFNEVTSERARIEFERAKEKHELSQIDLDKYFKTD